MSIDKTPLAFGKYKGQTPVEVASTEPSYVVWMYENVKPRPCSKSLYRYCVEEVQESWQDEHVFGHDCDQM